MDLGRDLSPFWIKVKASLFWTIATSSFVLLILERPEPKRVFLLACLVWSSCRAYYFAFHVIERYLDSGFRYTGLLDLVVHYWRNRPHDS